MQLRSSLGIDNMDVNIRHLCLSTYYMLDTR